MADIPMQLTATAQKHAQRALDVLGTDFNQLDADGVALYGMLCQTLEEIPNLELTPRDAISLQLKTVQTLNSVRRSLGLTKDEQRKASGATRIGRPPKNSTWEGMDV
jgi:hypothetical protein